MTPKDTARIKALIAKHADLIVDGTGALDWKVERVLTEMRTLNRMRFPE